MPKFQFHICFSSRLFQHFFGITCLLFASIKLNAQITDSMKLDSTSSKINIKQNSKFHSPKKAAIFSAIIPGAGQVYNKKYWKVPVFYAGLGALAYSINFNQKKYVTYRDAYSDRIDNNPSTIDDYVNIYNDDQLAALYKYYHRFRDLSAGGFLAVYLINVVDAAVDAHLFTFDVSDDLSLKVHPTLINTAGTNKYSTGLTLNINFKK